MGYFTAVWQYWRESTNGRKIKDITQNIAQWLQYEKKLRQMLEKWRIEWEDPKYVLNRYQEEIMKTLYRNNN